MNNLFADRFKRWLKIGLNEETHQDRLYAADLMVNLYYEYTLVLDKLRDKEDELADARTEIQNLTYQLQEVTSAKADGRADPEQYPATAHRTLLSDLDWEAFERGT
jgi:hypothetical protein